MQIPRDGAEGPPACFLQIYVTLIFCQIYFPAKLSQQFFPQSSNSLDIYKQKNEIPFHLLVIKVNLTPNSCQLKNQFKMD